MSRISECWSRQWQAFLLLAVFLLVSSISNKAKAQSVSRVDAAGVENVILITMDGLRFQELFEGAEERLIDKEAGSVDDVELTRARFLADTPESRRQLLMPFFWETVAVEGQVWGSPQNESYVRVENGLYFSYPGYNELLSGFPDPRIDSNDKEPNANVTVLEWLNRQEGFEDRVAAFCSWDVFPYIINEQRSGVPVNAGWEPLPALASEVEAEAYRQMAADLPRYWQSVRYDVFTFRGAMECLEAEKPRVLYVALGETDDWAHAGRYDLYLEAACKNDEFIRRIWEYVQSDEHYRDKTAMIISTDHGRGDGREGWKNHSDELPGSANIWIAAIGPNVPSLGVRTGVNATQGQIAASVADLLGFDFSVTDDRIRAPLDWSNGPGDEGSVERAGVEPLLQAHAHNDYYQTRPLVDALSHGFCSVEADIFLSDGELLVGHYEFELREGRTLESMYLDPLLERVQRNGGSVYGDPAPFMLLVDIKSNGAEAWPVLNDKLSNYREMLTYVENGDVVEGAVQVVVSGSRPFDLIEAEPVRFAGIDGRLSDLESDRPAHLVPLISDHWGRNFRWRGRTALQDEERDKLQSIVQRAHRSGRRVRFWATPENPALWSELLTAGVDHINTDQLERLQLFLMENDLSRDR